MGVGAICGWGRLCYGMLWYGENSMLCFGMVCYAMLCSGVGYTMLCYGILWYTMDAARVVCGKFCNIIRGIQSQLGTGVRKWPFCQ